MGQVAGSLPLLLDGAWTASAVARLLESGIDTPIPHDDPSVALLSKAGLLEDVDGGYVLAGREDLRGREAFILANIRSSLGQAAAIASSKQGWSSHDDDVLVAQGVSSSAGGQAFAMLIDHLGLAPAFERGGVLLDVGVGVAALACAFCESVPNSKVIGLDVLPRALELAGQLVNEKGLGDRVDLRRVGVEDFDGDAVADLAHMSPVFIPPAVLAEGLRRIRRALRPGGWLVLSGIVGQGPDQAALTWMIHNAGGSPLTDDDVAKLAADAGFTEPRLAPLLPGAPRVLLLQRADGS